MTRRRSLRHNQHGGGAAIAVATIMSMILVVALVQNVYIWGQTLTAEEADRVHESITIQQVYITNSSDLALVVQNTGSIPTHLISVWVEPVNASNESQRFMVNEYVSSDEARTIILDDSVLSDFNLSDLNIYSVVTERGNTAAYEFPQETEATLPEVYYLGVFGIDWFYSKYSSEQNPPSGGELEEAAYIIKSDDYVALYINITNSWDQPCAITSDSLLAFTTIAPPSGEPVFYLVQNVSYGGSTPSIVAYDNSDRILIYPNQYQVLIFASEDPMDANWQWGNGYPFGPETTTDGSDIQISLFYELYEDDPLLPTGQYFGQTISTHAVVLMEK